MENKVLNGIINLLRTLHIKLYNDKYVLVKQDRVGPVDSRPSKDKLHHLEE